MLRTTLAFALLCIAAGRPALAQETLSHPGIEGTGDFVTLLPALADMTAPDWVRPGTRITFYTAYASIPAGGGNLVEDPNGRWHCKANGKRYRFTEETGENIGAGGEGYVQHDIVAVEGNAVASTYQCWQIDRTWGTVSPLGVPIGSIALAGNPGDLWIHPAALAQLEDLEASGVMIFRGTCELHGHSFNAITIASLGQGASIRTYDLESGVLLRSSTKTGGRPDDVRLETEPTPRVGATHQTMQVFCGVRQTATPLVGAANPAWVQGARALSYAGEVPQYNPLDGSYLGSGQVRYAVSLGRRGATWCQLDLGCETVIGGYPQTWRASGMGGGSGPFWIEPQAAAGLEPGRILDEDPITGMTLSVDAADGRAVTLVWANASVRYEYVYDLSNGVLSAFSLANQVSGTHVRIALEGVER